MACAGELYLAGYGLRILPNEWTHTLFVWYTLSMDLVIIFRPSAFKHGVTEADVRHAFRTMKYDAELDEPESDGKHLLIGFDCNANLIEILYANIDDDTVRVFHAMKCRTTFIALLNL
ncbi:MAG: hypothetical protein Ta2A_13990 [Treponemataceae bacterium]|nr:MAG: hypothetical protein Ta2A_13990 [Treponemataceae bacterium]